MTRRHAVVVMAMLVVVTATGAALWAGSASPGDRRVAATEKAVEVRDVRTTPLPDGTAVVTWTTSAPVTATVRYGVGERLDRVAVGPQDETRHEAVLTGLAPNRTYHLRVAVDDAAGERRLHPPPGRPPLDLVTPDVGVTDTTLADFLVGERRGVTVVGAADGSLELSATLHDDFREAAPVAGATVGEGGRAVVHAGRLELQSARLVDDRVLPAGHTRLVLRATFSVADGQRVGLGSRDDEEAGAVLRVEAGRLHVGTTAGGRRAETRLDDVPLEGPHDLEVVWTEDGATYRVDGRHVATHDVPVPSAVVFVASAAGPDPLQVERVTGGEHARRGEFVSDVLDAAQMVTWRRASWDATTPLGTAVDVEVRTGSRRQPDGSWTSWRRLRGDGDTVGGASRYLQYRVHLRGDGATTPTVRAVSFTHDGQHIEHEGEQPGSVQGR